MRIGILLEHADPGRGGLERWALQYLRWLEAAGDSVEVASRTVADGALGPGVRWHRLPDHADRRVVAQAARQWIREAAPNAVHDLGVTAGFHLLHLQAGCRIACRIAEASGYSTVQRWATFASPRFWRRAWQLRSFERWQIHQHAGPIVVPSARVVRDFERWHGLSSARFTIVPNTTDISQFAPLTPRPQPPDATDPIRLLFVATNPWLKGLDLLLDALRNWPASARPFRLTVVGVAKPDPWMARIQRLGLATRTTWLGRLSDTRTCYAGADVLVHPSRRDAGSLVLWEAWAAGLPVIGSPDDGSAEHIREGINGWRLPASGNTQGLRECLLRVAANPDLASMATACRSTAEAYTLQHQFSRLRALLETSP